MRKWTYLATAIGLEVMATMSLRAMDGFTYPWWLIVVILGYLGAFAMLSQVLKIGMPVGVAYGIWAATGVALTAVLGRVIFSDPLTWTMGAGVVLIMGGVLLIEIGAH